MSNPDELEKDIDRTRGSLSANVDKLNDKVSPSKVVGRRMDRVRSSAGTIRERVMGYADNSDGSRTDAVNSAASSAQDKANAAASKVADAAGSAPQAVRDQTQGNPIAAGVIAFGVGWLVSALLPASDAEQQLAAKAEDNAAVVAEPLKQSAQEVAGNLQQPLQDATEQIKGTADDAASRTADQARSAKDDLDKKNPLT